MKRINEIFNNSEAWGNLNTAIVEAVVLREKSNILEMKISSDKYIEISEIESLNTLIKEKLALKDSEIIVEYSEGTEKRPIEEELKNIVLLLADKYPFLKSAINKSEYEIANHNTINFSFKIEVSYLLKARGYDKVIQEAIKNLYGTVYQINFIDKVSREELTRLQKATQENEMLLIQKEVQAAPPSHNPSELSMEAAEIKQGIKAETDGKKGNPSLILGRNANIKDTVIKITDITPDEGKIALEGEISNIEAKELKSGKTLISFDLYDGSSSMTCKSFIKPGEEGEVLSRLIKAKGVKLSGNAGYSKFSGEIELIANTIVETEGLKKAAMRRDLAEVKRVELHLHTQMSQMDGMTSATDLIKRAMSWGMKSIAITDHGVVQSFPEAHKFLGRDNPDMKVIYGVEAYLAPDKKPAVTNSKGQSMDTPYCVLDLETTGFSAVTEKITEIGIMKLQDGKVIAEFSCFVNPEKPIPERVVEVTNITDEMVKNAETIEQVFPKMLDFINGSVLVAHNAEFDIGFLKHNAKVLGYDFDYTYLDTLSLAKELFPEYKTYKLGRIAKNLGIKVEVAHRALDDVDTTVKVLKVMLEKLKQRGAETLEDIDRYGSDEEAKKEEFKKLKTYP